MSDSVQRAWQFYLDDMIGFADMYLTPVHEDMRRAMERAILFVKHRF